MRHLFITPVPYDGHYSVAAAGFVCLLACLLFPLRMRKKNQPSTGLCNGWEWVEADRKVAEGFKTWQSNSSLGKQTYQ